MSTGAQAAALVAAARFPPQGVRGFGSPFTQQAWGADLSAADYLARANDAVVVLVQIETRGGVENLDDILAVDGLGASRLFSCFALACPAGAEGLMAVRAQTACSSARTTSRSRSASRRRRPTRTPRWRR